MFVSWNLMKEIRSSDEHFSSESRSESIAVHFTQAIANRTLDGLVSR
jgi:hypothetical protein